MWRAILALICCTASVSCQRAANQARLLDDLLYKKKYFPDVPPIEEGPLDVKYGLMLQYLNELNYEEQTITLNAWEQWGWNDFRLRWDPENYGNVSDIRLPIHRIWKPDLALYNAAAQPVPLMADSSLVVLSSKGDITWVPPMIIKAMCAHELEKPFHCHVKVGSWTYDGGLLNPTNTSKGIDLSTYQPNNDIGITSTSVVRNVQKYDCCPNAYIDLTFSIEGYRK